jgi:hypothetical protein
MCLLLDPVPLQSKFFPAKNILEKKNLAGKNLLCKEGFSVDGIRCESPHDSQRIPST